MCCLMLNEAERCVQNISHLQLVVLACLEERLSKLVVLLVQNRT